MLIRIENKPIVYVTIVKKLLKTLPMTITDYLQLPVNFMLSMISISFGLICSVDVTIGEEFISSVVSFFNIL